MDAQRFEQVTAGMRSLATFLAVVIGGVWTWFVLGPFDARAKAEAEVLLLQQQIHEEPVVSFEIDSRQTSLPGASCRYLLVGVTAQNKGNRPAFLDLSTPPLSISRVVEPGRSPRSPQKWLGAYNYVQVPIDSAAISRRIKDITLRRGDSQRLEFFVRVGAPGLYLITFRTPVPRGDILKSQVPRDTSELVTWSVTSYVVVR